MTVVTVDFDGTLFKGNSFNVMFQTAKEDFTLKEWSVVGLGLAKSMVIGMLKGKEAFKKEFFYAFATSFKGRTESELEHFFKKLVEVGKKEINWKLVDKIHQHKDNGDEIIIVSGALHPFLKEFIKEINLDVPIISSELVYDRNGRCTGEIRRYINGEEKVRHVQRWMRKKKKDKNTQVWAYADSKSDMPLFRFANHPIVVNPSKEMSIIANQYQWSVF